MHAGMPSYPEVSLDFSSFREAANTTHEAASAGKKTESTTSVPRFVKSFILHLICIFLRIWSIEHNF